MATTGQKEERNWSQKAIGRREILLAIISSGLFGGLVSSVTEGLFNTWREDGKMSQDAIVKAGAAFDKADQSTASGTTILIGQLANLLEFDCWNPNWSCRQLLEESKKGLEDRIERLNSAEAARRAAVETSERAKSEKRFADLQAQIADLEAKLQSTEAAAAREAAKRQAEAAAEALAAAEAAKKEEQAARGRMPSFPLRMNTF